MNKVSIFILKYILKIIVLDTVDMCKEKFLEKLGLKRKCSVVRDEIEENIPCLRYNNVVDKFCEGYGNEQVFFLSGRECIIGRGKNTQFNEQG